MCMKYLKVNVKYLFEHDTSKKQYTTKETSEDTTPQKVLYTKF